MSDYNQSRVNKRWWLSQASHWPSLVSLKQHLFSHENIYEITWLKWITCVLLSWTKRSYDSQSYSRCIFSLHGMWKVSINLCNLHHFDSETSHHFKSNFSSLSVTRHVSLFQKCCHLNIKINLKLSRFIRMKCFTSYCTKRNNCMIYRITMNVFFIHWIARGKYRLSVFCIT